MRRGTLLLAAAAGLLVASFAAGEDWPSWRGPTGQGLSSEKGLPLKWGGKDAHNVRWKVPLPGQQPGARPDQNQSSPIVRDGRVFVTMSYWPKGVDRKEFPEHHVACYRARDGRLLWDTQVAHGPWSRASDLRGGYTAPTPAADSERVYVVFGSSVLAALDFKGTLLWRKEIVPYKFDVAVSSSPVLYQDTVLLQCDQVKGFSRLLAFERKSGEQKWMHKRPQDGFSHSTPVLVRIKGKPELLMAAAGAVQGVDPADGTVRWWCSARGDTVSPVYGAGLVYLDSGRGGPGVAVDPNGSGDVTSTHRKWRINHIPEGFSSPVIVDKYLYRLCNPASLRCYRLADGKEIYNLRLPGVSTASSPIVTADDRIYLASAGKSYVLKAGPDHEMLAANDLGDASQASAAVAAGCIFLKGRTHLYCIGSR
jgi:outer membrane protein assembly factor BamB